MSYDVPLSARAAIGMEAARNREPLPVTQPRRGEPRRVLATAEIESHDGATQWHRDTATTVGTPAGPITRVHREQVLDAFDPHDYEPLQPADIRVLHRHDRARRVGRVLHLEWGQGEPSRILAVFEVDEAEAESWAGRDVFVSPGTTRNDRGRLVLDHLGLVPETARIAATPVKWAGSDFASRSRWTRQTTPGYDVLTRAHDALRKRAKGVGIPIVGHPGHDAQLEEQRTTRDPGPLTPEYMRRNGQDGLFFSGGTGWVIRVT
jgi:hypothetical protein